MRAARSAAGNAGARFGLRVRGSRRSFWLESSASKFGRPTCGCPRPRTGSGFARRDLTDSVFPLHADARSLPFAAEFFDAIVAVDCYPYFGTDDLYLNYLVQFVKPGGQIGIAGAGLVEEMPTPVPEHLREFWTQDLWALHSVGWWRRHWERTGLVEIQNCRHDERRLEVVVEVASSHCAVQHRPRFEAVEADAGRHLGYIRLVGTTQRRREARGVCLAGYAQGDAQGRAAQQRSRESNRLSNRG